MVQRLARQAHAACAALPGGGVMATAMSNKLADASTADAASALDSDAHSSELLGSLTLESMPIEAWAVDPPLVS